MVTNTRVCFDFDAVRPVALRSNDRAALYCWDTTSSRTEARAGSSTLWQLPWGIFGFPISCHAFHCCATASAKCSVAKRPQRMQILVTSKCKGARTSYHPVIRLLTANRRPGRRPTEAEIVTSLSVAWNLHSAKATMSCGCAIRSVSA